MRSAAVCGRRWMAARLGTGDRRPDRQRLGRRGRRLGNESRHRSTSAWASPAFAATSCRATASTSRPTPARPGRTSASRARRRSPGFASTPRIPTSSSSRRSASTAPKRRTRRLQEHRRRQDLAAEVVPRRQDRRGRSGDRSQEPQRDVRRAVGGVPRGVPDVERRTRQRPLQVDRRRRDLDRDHAQHRAAGRRGRPHRRRRLGRRLQPRLRAGRERERRALPSDDAGRRGRWSTATGISVSGRSTTRTSPPIRSVATRSTC